MSHFVAVVLLYSIFIPLSNIVRINGSTTPFSSVSDPQEIIGKECTQEYTETFVTKEYYQSVCYRQELTCDITTSICMYKTMSYDCSRIRYKQGTRTYLKQVCCYGYLHDTSIDLCIRACPEGTYGVNCRDICTCGLTQYCDPFTGDCTCKPGYTGPGCVNVCLHGWYGANCTEQCLCDWNNTLACNSMNGTCWCHPGWTGVQCDIECPEGRYGYDCSSVCKCPENHTCDPRTGACTCPSGYTETNCSTDTESDKSVESNSHRGFLGNLSIIIPVVVGVIVVAASLVVVIQCIRKRNQKKICSPNNGTTYEVDTTDPDYYNIAVGKVFAVSKAFQPKRTFAPNGDVYTEVNKPPGTKVSVRGQPFTANAYFSSKEYTNVHIQTNEKYDELSKNGKATKLDKQGSNLYDHVKNTPQTSQGTCAYDELRKEKSDQATDVNDQYDHTKVTATGERDGGIYDKLQKKPLTNTRVIDDTYNHTNNVIECSERL